MCYIQESANNIRKPPKARINTKEPKLNKFNSFWKIIIHFWKNILLLFNSWKNNRQNFGQIWKKNSHNLGDTQKTINPYLSNIFPQCQPLCRWPNLKQFSIRISLWFQKKRTFLDISRPCLTWAASHAGLQKWNSTIFRASINFF
jgi:hypothetical protein